MKVGVREQLLKLRQMSERGGRVTLKRGEYESEICGAFSSVVGCW